MPREATQLDAFREGTGKGSGNCEKRGVGAAEFAMFEKRSSCGTPRGMCSKRRGGLRAQPSKTPRLPRSAVNHPSHRGAGGKCAGPVQSGGTFTIPHGYREVACSPAAFGYIARAMLKVFVPKERRPGETRVAATPDTVKKLVKEKLEIVVEAGAGEAASFLDKAYEAAGAKLTTDLRGAGRAPTSCSRSPRPAENADSESTKRTR